MSRIGLIGENSVEYIDHLLGIWNNGDCVVLIDWRIPFQTAVEMMKESDVSICYLENQKYHINEAYAEIDFIIYERKSNSPEFLPAEIYDKFKETYSQDEAVVLYSSGTTGKAKGIILSHYAINTNADSIIDYMKPIDNDCIYIAKVLSHSSTLTGEVLVALKTKMNLVIAPTIVPPRLIFRNIVKFGVSIICLNPTLLQKYAEEYETEKHKIPTLKTIYVSGSILNDKVYHTAHSTFKDAAIYNVYGLSEAGPRVTSQRSDCCKGNSVGKPIKEIDIAVVYDNGNIVKRGELGIIHVNTPSRFNGYISGNEKHISLYQGWINTGDIGYLDENDELYIKSRVDDVIIIDSHKVYPCDIEKQVVKNTSIAECTVVKLENNGNEFIGCLYSGNQEIEINTKERLNQVLMAYEIPRFFLKCESLPRTMNGKTSTNEAAKILLKALEMEVVL